MTATLRPPDLENLAGQHTGRRHLSHSRLGVYLACEEKYRWQYVERLQPVVRKESLQLGAAFATALEEGDPLAGEQEILDAHDDLQERLGSDPWIVVPSREDAEVQSMIVRGAAGAYLAGFGARAHREVELKARVRNPETGAYSRTFDVMARVDGLNGSTLIEDKLLSKVEPATEQKLKFDRQVTLGAYLIWRTSGVQVDTIRYRITKKPSIRRRQNESHIEFCQRILADYEARPEFYVHEFVLKRGPVDFLRLERELWRWCEQIRSSERDGVWPRNIASCGDYGGCPMLPLCAREPDAMRRFEVRPEHRPDLEKRDTTPTEVAA